MAAATAGGAWLGQRHIPMSVKALSESPGLTAIPSTYAFASIDHPPVYTLDHDSIPVIDFSLIIVVASLFLGLVVVSSLPGSLCRFMVENSLRVTSPDSVKGTYDSAIGNFGIPQYGGSMAGVAGHPKDNRKGCQEFDKFGISFQSKPGSLPIFWGFLTVSVDFWFSGPSRMLEE